MKWTTNQGKTIDIRLATEDDAQAILDCMSMIFAQSKNLAREPEEWTMTTEQEVAFLKRMKDSKDGCMVIALDGNIVIATASIQGSSLRRLRHRVTLGISLLEAYHRQGIGKQLMLFMIEQAKQLHKRTIDLEVRADNIAAIELYKQVGFIIEGIKKGGFYVDGNYVDELLMALYLED